MQLYNIKVIIGTQNIGSAVISFDLLYSKHTQMHPIAAFIVAASLAVHGYRRRSLSVSGAIAAWIVGLGTMASGIVFGSVLVVFYLAGSRATKVGFMLWCFGSSGYVLKIMFLLIA
jgi:hypothetical protein